MFCDGPNICFWGLDSAHIEPVGGHCEHKVKSQVLLAYHKNNEGGFVSNNKIDAVRRGCPRPKRRRKAKCKLAGAIASFGVPEEELEPWDGQWEGFDEHTQQWIHVPPPPYCSDAASASGAASYHAVPAAYDAANDSTAAACDPAYIYVSGYYVKPTAEL